MNNKYFDRIQALRSKALKPSISFHNVYLDFLLNYSQNTRAVSREEKYAEAYTYALSRLTPSIDDDEIIVGKPAHPLPDERKDEWEAMQLLREELATQGQHSHMSIDYELLLKEGTSGICKKIDTYKAQTQDTEKLKFYQLAQACLSSVEVCAENYAKRAREMAEGTTDCKRKKELLDISEVCSRVPKYPARSFHEAVQSVNFITYLLTFEPFLYRTMQYQLGHPDRYLWQYYQQDIESGAIDKEYAQFLLDCLAVQINNRVPSGLSSGFMVGGRDKNGKAVQNDLTEMCMQTIEDVHLVYPAVGLCMTRDTDEKYLVKACEILSHGHSHPAIFNDEIITEGLRLYGVSETDVNEYIHSTCVEITPVGASSIWVASPYTNMPQILLDVLSDEYKTFDELVDACFVVLDEHIGKNYQNELLVRKSRIEKCLCPLLSCFVDDCLAKGIDIEQGGAKYQWIMPSFVGVANLVDSLYALKELVFEKKRFTMQQMIAMMQANFQDYEAERNLLLNHVAKYGNDIPSVDALFDVITRKIIEICAKYTDLYGNKDKSNRLVPSVFCWVMHERYGNVTGATPDGRHAGFPLGDGSGPCQGREKSGPLASILSSTSWSHKEMIGGVAVNMKFAKRTFTSNSLKNMTAIIKAYLEKGGFEIQINVVDQETLLAAQQHPENYEDLVVRIGGYSDYFVRLSPQMQAEVLLRTTHEE